MLTVARWLCLGSLICVLAACSDKHGHGGGSGGERDAGDGAMDGGAHRPDVDSGDFGNVGHGRRDGGGGESGSGAGNGGSGGDSLCEPMTCQQQGFSCGAVPDGCGGVLRCGTCG